MTEEQLQQYECEGQIDLKEYEENSGIEIYPEDIKGGEAMK